MIVHEQLAPRTGESRYPERRGVSKRSVIEEAKKIATIDLADRLVADNGGGWMKVGGEWFARCPLPDHADRTPSFSVNPEKNVFWCFGCLRGGDVIELARIAWGYEKSEVAMAAAEILQQFGHPIPARPLAWFAKQKRQQPVRDAIEEAKLEHHQRRVFRRIFAPLAKEIEDDAERREEAEILWEAAGEIAAMIMAGRRAA